MASQQSGFPALKRPFLPSAFANQTLLPPTSYVPPLASAAIKKAPAKRKSRSPVPSRVSKKTPLIAKLHYYQVNEEMTLTDFFRKQTRKKLKFPEKLMLMLIHVEKTIKRKPPISWAQDGNAFVIHDREALAKDILPLFFKKGPYESFTRKLYRWGFRKLGEEVPAYPDRNKSKEVIYGNLYFRRDKKQVMEMMRSTTAADKKRAAQKEHICQEVNSAPPKKDTNSAAAVQREEVTESAPTKGDREAKMENLQKLNVASRGRMETSPGGKMSIPVSRNRAVTDIASHKGSRSCEVHHEGAKLKREAGSISIGKKRLSTAPGAKNQASQTILATAGANGASGERRISTEQGTILKTRKGMKRRAICEPEASIKRRAITRSNGLLTSETSNAIPQPTRNYSEGRYPTVLQEPGLPTRAQFLALNGQRSEERRLEHILLQNQLRQQQLKLELSHRNQLQNAQQEYIAAMYQQNLEANPLTSFLPPEYGGLSNMTGTQEFAQVYMPLVLTGVAQRGVVGSGLQTFRIAEPYQDGAMEHRRRHLSQNLREGSSSLHEMPEERIAARAPTRHSFPVPEAAVSSQASISLTSPLFQNQQNSREY